MMSPLQRQGGVPVQGVVHHTRLGTLPNCLSSSVPSVNPSIIGAPAAWRLLVKASRRILSTMRVFWRLEFRSRVRELSVAFSPWIAPPPSLPFPLPFAPLPQATVPLSVVRKRSARTYTYVCSFLAPTSPPACVPSQARTIREVRTFEGRR